MAFRPDRARVLASGLVLRAVLLALLLVALVLLVRTGRYPATSLLAAVAVAASIVELSRRTRHALEAREPEAPVGALHGASRQVGASSLRLRTGLLLVQTTLCTALLVGAGLFVRSLDRASSVDLGISTARLLDIRIDLGSAGMPRDQQKVFYRDAVERLRAVPGVKLAGSIQGTPFGSNSAEGIKVPGLDTIRGLPGGGPYYFRVTPGALEALGVRLLRGRLFTDADGPKSPPVAVISDLMARHIWKGEDALGKCFIAGDDGRCREIVGIIRDVHRQEIEEAPFMLYFTPG